MKDIPGKFYRGSGRRPVARTVNDLLKVLSELPKSLRLEDRYKITVYNYGHEDMHVSVEVDDE